LINRKKKAALTVFAVMLMIAAISWWGGVAFGQNKILYWGSSGSEVTKVQALLNKWGYYTGPIDGYFSSKTYRAVVDFQRKNGLLIDGVVGPQTWAALGLPAVRRTGTATVADSSISRGISDRDTVSLLARVIQGEAANEPYVGKVAVGAVIVNRMQSGSFPGSLAGVVYQPGAFESVSNGQYTRPLTNEALRAAQEALAGWDPSGGALFFWNPSKQVSSWIWSRSIISQIGSHVFAR